MLWSTAIHFLVLVFVCKCSVISCVCYYVFQDCYGRPYVADHWSGADVDSISESSMVPLVPGHEAAGGMSIQTPQFTETQGASSAPQQLPTSGPAQPLADSSAPVAGNVSQPPSQSAHDSATHSRASSQLPSSSVVRSQHSQPGL